MCRCLVDWLCHGRVDARPTLFPGESGIDQLVEIIKVLGTPTRDQIRTMNPNYMEHKFPQIKPHPFNKVFRKAAHEAIELISAYSNTRPHKDSRLLMQCVSLSSTNFVIRAQDSLTRVIHGGSSKELPTSLRLFPPW